MVYGVFGPLACSSRTVVQTVRDVHSPVNASVEVGAGFFYPEFTSSSDLHLIGGKRARKYFECRVLFIRTCNRQLMFRIRNKFI